jgi:hypothetical protein
VATAKAASPATRKVGSTWPATPSRRLPARSETVYGKTREEAHEKLIEALSNRNKGLIFEGENQTLSAYLDRWLNGSVKGSVKPSTYESYERMIRNHIKPALGHRKLKALAPDHVQYLYQSKLDADFAPGTVRLMHGILIRRWIRPSGGAPFPATSARPQRHRSRTPKRYIH